MQQFELPFSILPIFLYIMITVDGRKKYVDVDIAWLHKRYIFSAPSYYRLTIVLGVQRDT